MWVSEVFASVQGEGADAGRPCSFVRLAGCNLRCAYCDSAYALAEGQHRSVDEVLREVLSHGVPLVCVTGGEPLLQAEAVPLMDRLLARGLRVLLETNGSLPLDHVPVGGVKVVDVKTPGASRAAGATPASSPASEASSGAQFHYPNLGLLGLRDQVKLVLCDEADYRWACRFIDTHGLAGRVAEVLLSPCHGQLDARDLALWMVRDRLPARLNVQIHKTIWGPNARGV